jgi:hypothetical protein
MNDIDIHIAQLNFDKFILEDQAQSDDETMYQQLMERAQVQLQDY